MTDPAEPVHLTWNVLRRLLVVLVGGTVLALGVAMILLPGPAFVVIPVGISILAVEFAWARRLRRRFKEMVEGRDAPGPEEAEKEPTTP